MKKSPCKSFQSAIGSTDIRKFQLFVSWGCLTATLPHWSFGQQSFENLLQWHGGAVVSTALSAHSKRIMDMVAQPPSVVWASLLFPHTDMHVKTIGNSKIFLVYVEGSVPLKTARIGSSIPASSVKFIMFSFTLLLCESASFGQTKYTIYCF